MSTRILLVDDEPNVLSSLRRQLRSDYEVEVAEDPTAALLSLDKKILLPLSSPTTECPR